jgi:hypothetical protein
MYNTYFNFHTFEIMLFYKSLALSILKAHSVIIIEAENHYQAHALALALFEA